MNKPLLSNFTFTFKPAKHKRVNNSNNKVYDNIVYCVCVETKLNEFAAYLDVPSNLTLGNIKTIPFTEKSYELKGKTRVFTIRENIKDKPICIIRSVEDAMHFCGSPNQYTPFRHKYVYSGYIVKINGLYYFDVATMFESMSFCKDLVPNITLEDINNEYTIE